MCGRHCICLCDSEFAVGDSCLRCVSDISELRLQEHWDMLDVTSGDARSWYMISGDAKSWVVCIYSLSYSTIVHCMLLTKEAPSEEEESQPLGSRVPLTDEEFEASYPSGTRTDSSHSSASSDSTTSLLPDHPLTQVSRTPTPTRASFHHRTACIIMRAQPAMSFGHSARVAEAMALSDSAFWGELGDEDTDEDGEDESSDADDERERLDDEGHGLDDKGHGLDDKGHGLDDEDHGLEDEGLGLEEEKEAVLEGQQQAVPATNTSMGKPLGLGYEALRHRELAMKEDRVLSTFKVGHSSRSVPEQQGAERVYAFKQPTLNTWVDLEDGSVTPLNLIIADRVYTDIPAYVPLAAPVQTPPSSEWLSGSLLISPSSPVVPSPSFASGYPDSHHIGNEDQFIEVEAQLELHGSILHVHTQRLDALLPTLVVDIDRDVREMYTRSGAVRDEIFSQRYRLRSLKRKQERVAMTFGAL
ncbi:hypothetical protein Tco_0471187 [Tanacetum coccineum]